MRYIRNAAKHLTLSLTQRRVVILATIVCVRTCEWVFMRVQLHMCVWVCTEVGSQPLSCCFLRQALLLAWSLLSRLG